MLVIYSSLTYTILFINIFFQLDPPESHTILGIVEIKGTVPMVQAIAEVEVMAPKATTMAVE